MRQWVIWKLHHVLRRCYSFHTNNKHPQIYMLTTLFSSTNTAILEWTCTLTQYTLIMVFESSHDHPGQTPRFGAAAISILLEPIRQYSWIFVNIIENQKRPVILGHKQTKINR